MLALFALAGLLVGWFLNAASDSLPRQARKLDRSASHLPAILLIGKRPYPKWFVLHLGIELLTMMVFAGLGLLFGLTLSALFLASGYTLFTLIAIIDWKYRRVLNGITYPAMIVVPAVQILLLHHDPLGILVGGMLAFGVFLLVSWLKPGQLGGGDVKLAALIGLTFGFPQVLWALLVGAGAGGVAAFILLSRRAGRQYRIPYAPFLCFGAVVILLYYYL